MSTAAAIAARLVHDIAQDLRASPCYTGALAPPPAPSGHRARWCPGCGKRPIVLRAGLCRTCWDGSPGKAAQAGAAARANPAPGGHLRRRP